MREAVAACRDELLALVAVPDCWDAAAAADALRDCNNFLDLALADASLTPPQRSVAEVLRGVIRVHADRRDVLLWVDLNFLQEQVTEWKRLNSDRTHSPAPPQVPFKSIAHPADWWATGEEADVLTLVKELFPSDGAAPKVADWRLAGARNANAASTLPRRKPT